MAYQYHEQPGQIRVRFTGTGAEATFHLLLPGSQPVRQVLLEGKEIPWQVERVGNSYYIDVACPIEAVQTLEIVLQPA